MSSEKEDRLERIANALEKIADYLETRTTLLKSASEYAKAEPIDNPEVKLKGTIAEKIPEKKQSKKKVDFDKVVRATIEKETEKAYLLVGDDGLQAWVPKKAVKEINGDRITIFDWFVDKLTWKEEKP